MTEAEIRSLQQKLQAAGHPVSVDGKLGPNTRRYQAVYQAAQARKAEAAKVAAAQTAAQAQLEKQRLDAKLAEKRVEAELKAAADKRAADAAERQRAFERDQQAAAAKEARETREGIKKLGINAAALAAGVAGGMAYAKHIDKRRAESVKATATSLSGLAKEASKAIATYDKAGKNAGTAVKQLAGIVKAADKLKLGTRPAVGVGAAVALAAEGALARFVVADKFDDPTAKEAFQALGTASFVAATTLVGKGVTYSASPVAAMKAADLAKVEAARAIVGSEAARLSSPNTATRKTPTRKPPLKKAPAATRNIAKPAAKLAKPHLTGPAAVAVPTGMIGKLAAAGGKALRVVAPLALGATLVSAVASEAMAAGRRPGESRKDAFLRRQAVSAGNTWEMADTLSLGLLGAAATGAKLVGRSLTRKRGEGVRPAITGASARLASRRRAQAQVGSTSAAAPDGYVDAHTRRQGTKLVRVQARRQTRNEMMRR